MSAQAKDPPTLPPPTITSTNPSPSSSRFSRRPAKLKRASHQRQKSTSTVRQSVTRTPSIASTNSSFSEVKSVFASWIGSLRAGVSGAWTKAKGEYDTYLATQEGETRMQRRRNDIMTGNEPSNQTTANEESPHDTTVENNAGKRPATSDGNAPLPALKKRSMNTKKIKKQRSMGKLVLGKVNISYPLPNTMPNDVEKFVPSTSMGRPPPAPVYRATTGFEEDGAEGGLRTRVQSLETEISSLRAKLRWFEQSFGEIPADTLVDIQHSVAETTTVKKPRRSVFKEELGSVTDRNMCEASFGDVSILPHNVKALKGFENDRIDIIAEEAEDDPYEALHEPAETEDVDGVNVIPPESTIKLIPASPSTKSVASPPRPSRTSSHPSKLHESPPSSPTELNRSIDLLETLSPIHPNIMPTLVPRPSHIDLSQENRTCKLQEVLE